MSFIFEVLFYQPVFNLLMLFYRLGADNLGIAIILLAILTKVITIPLTKRQIDSAKKMQTFQIETKKIRKQYNKNPEKMNDELAKLSTKYMPAQLGGCLPLIISLIFFIQIRSVVIDLVDKGYHAFNRVAYVQEFKIPEDSVTSQIDTELGQGQHTLTYTIEASDGHTIKKNVDFYVVDNEDEGKEKSKEIKDREKDADQEKADRESQIAVYVSNFDKEFYTTDPTPEIQTYLRAPSGQTIEKVEVQIDGNSLTEQSQIAKGNPLNLDFLGMNLSRVGSDYWGNWMVFLPYLLFSALFGFTQFLTAKLQMPGAPDTGKSKDKDSKDKNKSKDLKQKKDKVNEEPDMAEIMQESSRQMIYILPFMTFFLSLGYLGGASLFPSAVTLFWTVQNAFVIIQQLLTQKELMNKFKSKFTPNERKIEL